MKRRSEELEERNVFVQQIVLFTVVSSMAYFFATHDMVYLCFLLCPVIVLLTKKAPYKKINIPEEVNATINKLPQSNEEVGNYFTKFMQILWPHIFSEERVQQFKENLQWVLDNTKMPYFERVILQEFHLSSIAPQITYVKLPSKPKAAKHSLVLEFQAIYLPTLHINALLKLNKFPDIKVEFNNLACTLDAIVQMEFKPDPLMLEIPFWTALDFSLTKPPTITGFDVTVFNMTNVFNKESLKNHMSQAASTALWGLCGQPNGFLWERVTGNWLIASVFGRNGLRRCSMKHRDMLRISILKSHALIYIKSYKISMPLALVTRAFRDQETTTRFFNALGDFSDNYNIEAFDNFVNECSGWEPSADELRSIMDLTFPFCEDWFQGWAAKLTASRSRMTRDVEKRIGRICTYINFLTNQKKKNAAVFEELKIESRIEHLFQQITTLQQRLIM